MLFCLGDAMNRWIRHHFSRKSRAKCLILIGPTGTGMFHSTKKENMNMIYTDMTLFLLIFENIIHR